MIIDKAGILAIGLVMAGLSLEGFASQSEGSAQPLPRSSANSLIPIPTPLERPQIARFNAFLDPLERELKGLTASEAADRLINGSARAGIFNLQALGRLYKEDHPEFAKARKRFKALEDGIGEYAKWQELLGKANASGAAEAEVLKLQAKRDAGRVDLERILIEETFIPADAVTPDYITHLRGFLESYPWKSAEDDRTAMIKRLQDELDTIKNTNYDFNFLEHGDGIHEFRRKLRWFPMEARALNGMVLLKPAIDGDCPIDAYKDLPLEGIANNKYSILYPSAIETRPILLTPCLYIAISKAIDDIGIIKGIVESEANAGGGEASDVAQPQHRDAAQAILDTMRQNNLFDLLSAELAGQAG